MQRTTKRTNLIWLANLKYVFAIGVLLALLFSGAEGTRLAPYPDASIPASERTGLDDSRYSYNQTIKPDRSSQAKSVKFKHARPIGNLPSIVQGRRLQSYFAYLLAASFHQPVYYRSPVALGTIDTRGPPSI